MKMPTIELFQEYRYLSDPQLSPDGTRCAYVVAQANEDNGYDSALWLQRPEQAPLYLAALGPAKGYAWDGDNALLFAANDRHGKAKEGETIFYRLSLEGGEAREAFRVPFQVNKLKRLSQGNYLLLAEWNKNALDDPGAEEERRKAEQDYQVVDELPYWSNGRGFVNGLRRRAYLFREQDGTAVPLTGEDLDIRELRLSPCGRYAAFVANRCQEGLFSRKTEIWEYDFLEKSLTRRLDGRYYVDTLDYWKDDIVFTATDGARYGINENPWLYHLDRGGDEEILARWDFTVGHPVNSDCRMGGGGTFRICGDTLYFTSLQGYACGLYRASLPSGDPERIGPDDGSFDSFDTHGKAVYAVAMREGRLQELYQVEEGRCRRLTDCNDAIHRQVWYGEPRYHSFTDSDGVEIDGWVIEPADHKPGTKCPAVLHVHGGPKTAFGDIYFHEMQVWAARGWYVLYCNPRGGDGRGNEFMDIRGKYGTGDYRDLMEFTDRMLECYPDMDGNRMGMTGGSYGGFMANWMVGHTDRFRAVVSQRSISNWVSMGYVSDIGHYFVQDQIAANAWDSPETLWEKSPLKYANRAKTPTLFIHSDEDYRCWIPEGYQMYTALKLHGVDTRMVVFHGENHELSRSGKPSHRVRRMQEIVKWFEHYL